MPTKETPMSTFTRPAVALLSGAAWLALAGCATNQEYAASPARPGSVVADDAYVAAVERLARMRGIQVQWVNPPTRRIPGRTEP
jgi:hypothetical protein